jgi:hypothetical protein
MSQRYLAGYITASYNPLLVPNAPTIGTATGGNTQASVTFTAPANIGGSAITGYRAIARDSSSGAVFFVNGASSPIVVTGLTNGNTYTLTVVAINSFGAGPASAASNSVVANIAFGDALGGGFYAGNIVVSGITYRLIVAPRATGQVANYRFSQGPQPGSETITLNDGKTASSVMTAEVFEAGNFCENLTIGGFSDWYLPSRDELELCYRNLKPTTSLNDTSARTISPYTYPQGNDVPGNTMGVNLNSSPVGAAYTSSVPAQTSAIAFRSGGSEAFFTDNLYVTSSSSDSNKYWSPIFSGGSQYWDGFYGNQCYVRAVRRVAI